MDALTWSLIPAAAAIGLTHTLMGPDHYLPFIMLARVRGWSPWRTSLVTLACGVGHVAASLLLVGAGVAVGVAVGALESLEQARGGVAAWGLAGFGAAYALWGLRRGLRRARGLTPHTHGSIVHVHTDGSRHHRHDAAAAPRVSPATFWSLFAVFVLGPCEPLIPLFVVPVSRGRWGLAAAAAATFGAVTVAGMVGMTLLGRRALTPLPLGFMARWDHALAGGIIALSGLALLVFEV